MRLLQPTCHPPARPPALPPRFRQIPLMGLCGAVDTLASQASGAGQPVGIIFQRATLFLMLHCLVGGQGDVRVCVGGVVRAVLAGVGSCAAVLPRAPGCACRWRVHPGSRQLPAHPPHHHPSSPRLSRASRSPSPPRSCRCLRCWLRWASLQRCAPWCVPTCWPCCPTSS